IQAGGAVDAQAEASFRRALALDPGNAVARYSLGRAKVVRGDIAGGLADWRTVLATLAANDPQRPGLEADIASVEKTGKPITLQAQAPPAPAQQAGAAAMIHQMVDGLAARLKTNPDDPQGWVRLVRAYTVLGETGKRDAALAEARRRYAARPDVLSQLNAALAAPR
ncbi:MAG TPA: c-type cytochrome biogenesis protein CcmI, partial [Caulobacteraceae bacterium]